MIRVRLKTALLHYGLLLLSLQAFQLLFLPFSLLIESVCDGNVSCAREHRTAWWVTHKGGTLETVSASVIFLETPRRVSLFLFRTNLGSERTRCSYFFNFTLCFLHFSLSQHLFSRFSQLTPPLFPTLLLRKRFVWAINGQRVYFWLECTLFLKLILRLPYELSGSLPYFFIFSIRSNFISNCGLHKSGTLLLVSLLIVMRLGHGFGVENLWISKICSGLLLILSRLIVIPMFTSRFLRSNLCFEPFNFLFEHDKVRVSRRISILILHQRVVFILGVKRFRIEKFKLCWILLFLRVRLRKGCLRFLVFRHFCLQVRLRSNVVQFLIFAL